MALNGRFIGFAQGENRQSSDLTQDFYISCLRITYDNAAQKYFLPPLGIEPGTFRIEFEHSNNRLTPPTYLIKLLLKS